MSKKLVLFDIDGTLITSGGAGERALRLGFRECFGIEDDLSKVEIAGRTDSGIARRMLKAHALEENDANITAFVEAYLAHLAQELPRSPGRVLPGISPLLEALQKRQDVVLGLLTGNLQRGAELKLTYYGIWSYFEFGAYADDHHDRNQLGAVAQERAWEKHGIRFKGDAVYVLGDTAHDIACARAINARAVGVATGQFSRAQLAKSAPDFLFEDLSDLAEVLSIFSKPDDL